MGVAADAENPEDMLGIISLFYTNRDLADTVAYGPDSGSNNAYILGITAFVSPEDGSEADYRKNQLETYEKKYYTEVSGFVCNLTSSEKEKLSEYNAVQYKWLSDPYSEAPADTDYYVELINKYNNELEK